MTTTFHLTTTDQWDPQQEGTEYVPDAYAGECFIHCTDGIQNLVDVGNRYYRTDSRQFLCLEIDVDKLTSPVRYEDEATIYPHIYGPIQIAAVVAIRGVQRLDDGTFIGID